MRLQTLPPCACLLAALACAKTQGPPSVEFERARALHVDLVGRHADDAYGRPEMDQVLALLGQVPRDSVDAPEAEALKARILSERKRIADRNAERDRMLAAAGPGSWPASAMGAASTPGAGLPAKPALSPGLPLAAFREAYGDCFEHGTVLKIEGPDGGLLAAQGEAWGLKADPSCKDRYPDQADKVLLFGEGKLIAVRPGSDVKRAKETVAEAPRQVMVQAEVGPDGGLVPKRGSDGGYVYATDGGK